MFEKVNKPKIKIIGKRLKYGLGCCSFILGIVLVIGSIILVLTLTGHTKNWACNSVMDGSYIFEKFECDEDSNVTDNVNKEYEQELKEILSKDNFEERTAGIVKLVQPSIVGIGIMSDTLGEQGIVGTGFVIDKEGFIATNQHVVSNTEAKYFVQIVGMEEILNVEEIHRDQSGDLAIIKISKNDNLVPIKLGNSDEIMVGDSVIAIGNPLGNLSGTVTKGIVSGLNRTVKVNSGGFFSTGVNTFEGVIQTDAAINPGNSGGPLINMKGEVIGINFATVGGADNLSFALPINQVKLKIAELQEYGKFRTPFLGVEYSERLVFIQQKAVVAAQIRVVVPNSPAANAGLMPGDYIIGFENEDLAEKSLNQLIQEMKIDQDVKIVIIRDGKQMEINVKIGIRE